MHIGQPATAEQVEVGLAAFDGGPSACPCLLDEGSGCGYLGLGACEFEAEGLAVAQGGGVAGGRLGRRVCEVVECALGGAHGVSGVGDPGDEGAVWQLPLRTVGGGRIERGPGMAGLDEGVGDFPVVTAGALQTHGVPGLDYPSGALGQ